MTGLTNVERELAVLIVDYGALALTIIAVVTFAATATLLMPQVPLAYSPCRKKPAGGYYPCQSTGFQMRVNQSNTPPRAAASSREWLAPIWWSGIDVS